MSAPVAVYRPPRLPVSPSAERESRPSRITVDSRRTSGYPICPVGDSVRHQAVVTPDGDLRIDYPVIGWQIIHPDPGAGEALPSSAILDVWCGLMFLYHHHGLNEQGELRFSRYEFLQLIGWTSQPAAAARSRSKNGAGADATSGGKGTRRGRPSGRHYTQLSRALKYLSRTFFVQEGPGLKVGHDGELFYGEQGLDLIQYYRLAVDPPGPRREGDALPQRSVVVFSDGFRRLLDEGTIALDLDLMLSLPSGAPRYLYRCLAWLRQEGRATLPLAELFQRIGSTQSAAIPARARQILGRAHEALEQRGLLSSAPRFEKVGDDWHVLYTFGDPAAAFSEEELLATQAIAYGVTPSVARELVVAYRTRLAEVLAAVTVGVLRPERSLPGFVNTVTRSGRTIDDFGRRVSDSDYQLGLVFDRPEQQYLAWCEDERQRRLVERSDVEIDDIKHEIANATDPTAPPPSWFVAGMIAIRLNRRLGIPSFEVWRERLAD